MTVRIRDHDAGGFLDSLCVERFPTGRLPGSSIERAWREIFAEVRSHPAGELPVFTSSWTRSAHNRLADRKLHQVLSGLVPKEFRRAIAVARAKDWKNAR